MNILLLSCSTGGGHNASAQAVSEEFIRRGHSVTFIDPYELSGKNTAEYIGNSYVKLVQKSPQLFGSIYNLGEAYRQLPFHSPVYWASMKMTAYLKDFLKDHQFDAIVMTHMYPAHILTHLKNSGIILAKTILIATDYTCIPFMEETDCDYYVIPSSELKDEFISRGIPKEKLLPFGIPVRREFAIQTSEKKTLKKKLQLNPETSYILLSGGSIGAGKIEITVQIMENYLRSNRTFSLIVICGNNNKLYQHLHDVYLHNDQILLLQSTPLMAEYMHACEIFISKPGGLSSTEAAVSGTPLIHITPIPGCETHNADFFEKYGMSIFVNDLQNQLIPALNSLRESSVLQQMKLAQYKYINSQAATTLCDFIMKKCLRHINFPAPHS